jgi:hypothetical protein
MTASVDQPDYQQGVTPGVIRWASGTEFGVVSWSGDIAAVSSHLVNFAIPNDGCRYVMDKCTIYSTCVGLTQVNVVSCIDYSNPTWVVIGRFVGEVCFEIMPFSFVSQSSKYPNGLRWDLYNNVTRSFWLVANFYKYLTS